MTAKAGLKRRLAAPAVALAVLAAVAGLAGPATAEEAKGEAHPALWPKGDPDRLIRPTIEAKVAAMLARMSTEEKVGQLVQGDISTISPADLRTYPLGAILAGGNSGPWGNDRAATDRWVALVDEFHRVAIENRPGHVPVPVLFGIDAVHGHNNIIGATIFPHNIGLGAAHDPALLERIGAATAEEVAATGMDWAFAPTVAVGQDPRWGRFYESYSADPALVGAYAAAMVKGLQGEPGAVDFMRGRHVIASVKHFLGDGGTTDGHDQGDNAASEADLIRLHDAGYPPAIAAGAGTVMASFSSWQGIKMVANESLLTGVLKGRMGFGGFVVGDWNAHAQVPGCTKSDCPAAIDAGLDMLMAADGWKPLYANLLAEVRSGKIPEARLDDAVTRILRVKALAGLLDKNLVGPPSLGLDTIGSVAHRAVAREAVRRSLVLLKNENGLLPLKAGARVLVAGDGADNIPQQCGGWTISWQGTGNSNADFAGGTSIFAGIRNALAAGGGSAELSVDGNFARRPDVAIVVFGETPYAEFQGDIDTLEYKPGDAHDLDLLRRLRAKGIPIVAVFLSGRPLWVNPEINAADAFVAAWLPGTEGEGVADVLVRRPDGAVHDDFTGRLPFAWPNRAMPGAAPLFPLGYGLSGGDRKPVPVLSEDSGVPPGAARNLSLYFGQGHAIAPWSLVLRDKAGAARVAGTHEASPGGVLDMKSIDATAQEDVKSVAWTGNGAGSVAVGGPGPVDLGRQANGDMVLSLRYRLTQAPSSPVTFAMVCGTGCRGAIDVTGLLQPGDWRTLKIKLSCFAAAGAEMSRITEPAVVETAGRMKLDIAELRLADNTGDGLCPAK